MSTKVERLKEIKNNLKENIRDNAVVNHVKSNQNVYIPIACIVGTLVASHYWKSSQPGVVTNTVTSGDSAVNLIGSHNTVITDLSRRGHPGFIVQDLASGEVAASKNRLAAILDVSRKTVDNMIEKGDVVVHGLAQ